MSFYEIPIFGNVYEELFWKFDENNFDGPYPDDFQHKYAQQFFEFSPNNSAYVLSYGTPGILSPNFIQIQQQSYLFKTIFDVKVFFYGKF